MNPVIQFHLLTCCIYFILYAEMGRHDLLVMVMNKVEGFTRLISTTNERNNYMVA